MTNVPDAYEAEADRHLMLNLKSMDPAKRREWQVYCENTLLRSLLPPPPTAQELADAKRVLAAMERLKLATRVGLSDEQRAAMPAWASGIYHNDDGSLRYVP